MHINKYLNVINYHWNNCVFVSHKLIHNHQVGSC